ncbi:MAG: SpoIIE family protein phosphatase [Candidatus Eremiobacteraeota bacterium]|nr:SpoIIE family protein phosphatase [Candidatus Eremiobacteraeota bacterium]
MEIGYNGQQNSDETAVIFSVDTIEDVGATRRAVSKLTHAIGFDKITLAELDIVVSELATNLVVHYAINGEVVAREISDHLGKGVEIMSRDRGPGIENVQLAVQDHYSTAGGIGCGLGAVKRIMDEFDIYSNLPTGSPERKRDNVELCGTVITARKWLVPQISRRFVYSVNSRPMPGEKINGDGFFLTEDRDGLFVAVADGLGHGPEAGEASGMAIECIRKNYRAELDYLILETHKAIRKTRGVAMTLVRINILNRTLTHSGIGNVQARINLSDRYSLIPKGGILGFGAPPRPRITTVPWPKDGILVVFSDGISGRWNLNEIPNFRDQHVTMLSHLLMRGYERSTDDATVLVVKEVSQ